MKIPALPNWRRRTVILAGSAAVLIWLVITRSLAAYLAGAAPQAALWIDPRNPEALLALADHALNPPASATPAPVNPSGRIAQDHNPAAGRALQPGYAKEAFNVAGQNPSIDLPRIRAWAESAAMNAPLSARALRILGQVASIGNDDRDAAKYMAEAVRLSLHQSVAVYWMMRKSAAAGDYEKAVFYADALLRTNPDMMADVEPLLGHFAEQKASRGVIEAMLKTKPPWRSGFLMSLPRYISDARTPLDLLLTLRTGPAPPAADEIDNYLRFLIRRKFYELAYYTWLQFLPAAQLRTAGFLFNGSFEIAPSALPFDWAISQGSGVSVDIVPRPGDPDSRALQVDFLYGRVDYHSVRELVVLAPGNYRFTAQYNGRLVGPRGLKWRVVCAGDAPTLLGESEMIMDSKATWQDATFTFTVPAAGCPAQYVRLDLDARSASEDLVSGSILFSDLALTRVTDSPPVQETTR